jgi:NADH-ubiquinone oxidoreductase chain 1
MYDNYCVFNQEHITNTIQGPNRVGFIGLFQPFSDAIKLFTRKQYFPLVSNYLSCYFSPIFRLFLSLLV